jgi:hypothetical protein
MTSIQTGRGRAPEEQVAHLTLLRDDAAARLARCEADGKPDDKVVDARARLDAAQAELDAHDKGA